VCAVGVGFIAEGEGRGKLGRGGGGELTDCVGGVGVGVGVVVGGFGGRAQLPGLRGRWDGAGYLGAWVLRGCTIFGASVLGVG